MKQNFNIFLVNLVDFNTQDEIFDYLKSVKLSDNLSSEDLWKIKSGDFTYGNQVVKIWYDKTTFYAIAYQTEKEQKFNTHFISFLENMEPLSIDDTFIPQSSTVSNFQDLTVDSILDKINSNGMSSITKEELDFLQK